MPDDKPKVTPGAPDVTPGGNDDDSRSADSDEDDDDNLDQIGTAAKAQKGDDKVSWKDEERNTAVNQDPTNIGEEEEEEKKSDNTGDEE